MGIGFAEGGVCLRGFWEMSTCARAAWRALCFCGTCLVVPGFFETFTVGYSPT